MIIMTSDGIASVLIKALGLPRLCKSIDIRLRHGEPATVVCEYYPEPLTITDQEELLTTLKRYELQEKT